MTGTEQRALPGAAAYVPAKQSWQSEALVEPVPLVLDPAGHGQQDGADSEVLLP